MEPLKWTPGEIATLRRIYKRYLDGDKNITGYTLRGIFRGRSMSAISKKYWSIYGASGGRRTDVDINQNKFDFAQDKLENKNNETKNQ